MRRLFDRHRAAVGERRAGLAGGVVLHDHVAAREDRQDGDGHAVQRAGLAQLAPRGLEVLDPAVGRPADAKVRIHRVHRAQHEPPLVAVAAARGVVGRVPHGARPAALARPVGVAVAEPREEPRHRLRAARQHRLDARHLQDEGADRQLVVRRRAQRGVAAQALAHQHDRRVGHRGERARPVAHRASVGVHHVAAARVRPGLLGVVRPTLRAALARQVQRGDAVARRAPVGVGLRVELRRGGVARHEEDDRGRAREPRMPHAQPRVLALDPRPRPALGQRGEVRGEVGAGALAVGLGDDSRGVGRRARQGAEGEVERGEDAQRPRRDRARLEGSTPPHRPKREWGRERGRPRSRPAAPRRRPAPGSARSARRACPPRHRRSRRAGRSGRCRRPA